MKPDFAMAARFVGLFADAPCRSIVPSIQQWLPGASITAVASSGAEGVGYAHGMILGVVYVLVAIAAAITVFLRSDVTA